METALRHCPCSFGSTEIEQDYSRMISLLTNAKTLIDCNYGMIAHHSLEELNDFMAYHCAMEEALMKRYSLPSLTEYKKSQHQLRTIMLDTVSVVLNNTDGSSVSRHALDKLQQAIANHLHEHGAKLSRFLEEQQQ